MPNLPDHAFADMSPEELDLFIGNQLLKDDFGAKDATDGEKRATSKLWFEANISRFRGAVCSNATIRGTLFGKEKQERNLLFATVLDTVARLGGFPVPVAAVAAKIVHYGLDRLCEDTATGQHS